MSSGNKIIVEYISNSADETKIIGKKIAQNLLTNQVVAFLGTLGAGKTTLIKGLVSEINSCNENEICSPTFTYLNIYNGAKNIYHFDLYRIKDENSFLDMGFDEYFDKGGICLIEWSEKIKSMLPDNTLIIKIEAQDNETTRKISVLKT